jgi:hypothetical protein
MKHVIIMLLGCGLPILLIFLLPALGVGEGVTLTVFLVLMLVCHLLHFKLHSTGGHHHED